MDSGDWVMIPENIVEYNSLSWVKTQLDDVLSDALSNLSEYVEDGQKDHLENCVEYLQLVYGTLQMVEVYGAAMLSQEMLLTTTALLEDKVDNKKDTYDVLMRAMLQLPDYLETIQAGSKDTPITLMPLFNDLRVARKEGLLSESALFSPEIESAEISSDNNTGSAIETGKLQNEVKRLRTHFQIGLLDYIRNKKELAGLKRIKAVLNALEKVSSCAEVRRIWIVVGTLAEGLIKKGIDSSISINMLLASVDRELKLILNIGEDRFEKEYSKELVKNALYYIGICSIDSERILAVKEAYKLNDLIPQQKQGANTGIGGLNTELFNTVSKGITNDIEQVKDVLELFVHGRDQNVEQLVGVVDQLGKIADTYGMLGMGATRQAIVEQRSVLEKIIDGSVQASEEIVSGVAYELLNAESELKDYISSRSGTVDITPQHSDQIVPASEYREVISAVVAEALKNFSEAKEAILIHVSGSASEDQLDIIVRHLDEVYGAARMLQLARVSSQIEKLQEYIQVALIDNNRQIELEEQDTLADVVSSIEYYFEALSKGQPGVEHGLNAGDKAAAKLEGISAQYTGKDLGFNEVTESANVTTNDATDSVNDSATDFATETKEELIVDEGLTENDEVEAAAITEAVTVVSEQVTSDSGISLMPDLGVELYSDGNAGNNAPADNVSDDFSLSPEIEMEKNAAFNDEAIETAEVEKVEAERFVPEVEPEPEVAATEEVVAKAVQLSDIVDPRILEEIESYEILDENADEEIVEIFIEEAVEVLGELHENVPKWQADVNNEEALADMRRGFHTLKGSGRIIGAQLIGEFSWKIEDLLNRVIDKKILSGDAVNDVLDESLAVLPQLIEQLKGNREPIENISQLMLSIDAISEGRNDDYEALKKNETLFDIVETHHVEKAGENVDIDQSVSKDDTESKEEITLLEIDESQNQDGVSEENIEISLSDTLDEIAGECQSEIDAEITDGSEINNLEFLNELGMDDSEIESESEEIYGPEEEASEIEALEEELSETGKEEIDDVENDELLDESSEEALDIDPVLLKIYYDESKSHIETIQNLVSDSAANNKDLKADKNILRAFHTLYGSARTAGVAPVAELSGVAEKYIKVRQENGADAIPQDVVNVISEIEQSISAMLCKVEDGKLPESNRALHDKISEIVKQELQEQLQSSWKDNRHDDYNFDEELAESNNNLHASEEVTAPSSNNDLTDSDKNLNFQSGVDGQYSDIAYEDVDDELIDIFLEEAEELLESCEHVINEIKSTPNSTEHIQQLQRNMHTFKGGARMAGLTPVGDLTHNLESLVVMVEDKKIRVDKALLDVLNESLDALATMLTEVKERKPLINATELNITIESLMRGEVQEKRAVERFDVDVDALRTAAAERDAIENVASKSKKEIHSNPGSNPHWGERAGDVNFKDSQDQVRVRSDLLNNLVNYAGEVNIYHARMGKQISDYSFNLSELSQTVDRLKMQLRNLEIETEIQIRSGYEKESDNYDDNFDPLEMDQYSTIQQLTRSLGETASDVESIKGILSDITRDSETLLIQESRISTDLQEGLMRTRMVRFGGLSSRLRRIVRQVSKELDKEVELDIIGESSEVDRTVLDRIIAPLEHMLRNAVAHGIEKPDMRRDLGKNEIGRITIEVTRQGADVVINVEDDGSGIDAEAIKQKAIEQGLLEEDADVSVHDVLQFILQSGFSTADEVTQVAGRGVGMDVVDSEIKQLGGVMDIDTTEGKGTRFHIRLPLTLAINQALLVKASDDVFAIPLASIEGVVRITGYELQQFYNSDNNYYEFNGIEYDLKNLGGMLTGNQGDYSKQLQLFPVLLVHVGEQHFALHVDDLIGRREIVVKPVGMQIGAVRGIAGATILADGQVVLILEMSALVVAESLFKVQREIEQEEEKTVVSDKKTIMVVDDSITIRKVTERMLQRHDIEVVLAKDGIDATNQLQERMPDLMLLDIEMPRMDGFEVASFVRNDDRLKDLPIIMITSRTGAKHKEKAMEIGVNQYLGKPFQEEELLGNINKILKTSF